MHLYFYLNFQTDIEDDDFNFSNNSSINDFVLVSSFLYNNDACSFEKKTIVSVCIRYLISWNTSQCPVQGYCAVWRFVYIIVDGHLLRCVHCGWRLRKRHGRNVRPYQTYIQSTLLIDNDIVCDNAPMSIS